MYCLCRLLAFPISSVDFIDVTMRARWIEWGWRRKQQRISSLVIFFFHNPENEKSEIERQGEREREWQRKYANLFSASRSLSVANAQSKSSPSVCLSLSILWLSDPRSNRACSLCCFFIVLETSVIEKSILEQICSSLNHWQWTATTTTTTPNDRSAFSRADPVVINFSIAAILPSLFSTILFRLTNITMTMQIITRPVSIPPEDIDDFSSRDSTTQTS